MSLEHNESSRKLGNIAAAYNMIPNFIWSAVFLVPIALYTFLYLNLEVLFTFLALSLIPVILPNSVYDKIQISQYPNWYEKFGVKTINMLAQNGGIINSVLRRKYGTFRVVSKGKASINKQFYQTYFYERFHLFLFLYFLIVTVNAAIRTQLLWFAIFLVSNIFYNVYPNLLQQYIRTRLKPLRRSKPEH